MDLDGDEGATVTDAPLKRAISSVLVPPQQRRRASQHDEGAAPSAPGEASADPLLEPPCDDDFTRQRSPSEGGKPQLLVAASTPALAQSALPPRPPRTKSVASMGAITAEGEGTNPRMKSPRLRQWTNVRSSVSSVSQVKSGGSAKNLVTRAHTALQKCIDALVVGRFPTAQVRAEQACAILCTSSSCYRLVISLV